MISENSKSAFTVAIGGNCNLDFMVPSLKANFKQLGFATEIVKLDYNNWIGAALSSEISADYWIIWHSSYAATLGNIERPETDFFNIQAASQSILAKGAKLFFVLPEALSSETDSFSDFRDWRRELVNRLNEILPPPVVKVDVESLQRSLGDKVWYSPKYWLMTKSPCHPNALTHIGKKISTIVSQSIRPKIKAIITDLDDTLWGGIIGDDGLEGIQLDPFAEGRSYLELQRFLKDLISKGVPISVVTKNEIETARLPFEKHPQMILKENDILYFSASWDLKSIAIKKIIKKLNIGADAVCFLDDNPFEREQVKKELPELFVPELPKSPEERVAFLRSTDLFTYPVTMEEDRQRVNNYQIEIKRNEELHNAPDQSHYLASLGLKLKALPINSLNIERVVSLIQKTNQFNLSNRRHLQQDVLKMVNNPENFAFCYSLEDKFGDYGIISVFIALKENDGYFIDTWVLSCRVFGRQVQDAILDHFASCCGPHTVRAGYVESAKNNLVANFLLEKGFLRNNVNDFFVSEFVNNKHFITIEG